MTLYQIAMLCDELEQIRKNYKKRVIADNEKAQKMLEYYARMGINAL